MHSQVDGELMLAPGFPAPPNTDYIGYHTYIGMYTVFVQDKYYKFAKHYHKIQFLWCSYILKFLLILDGCKTNNQTMKYSQHFLGRTCDNQDRGYAAQTTWTVMHRLLFIYKLLFLYMFRAINAHLQEDTLYTCSTRYCHPLQEFMVACRYTA